MGFWSKKSTQTDTISSEALADFGRYEFVGADQSGISDAYSLVSALVSVSYPLEGPGYHEVISELYRHAEKGEWEKVGAWKFVREFLDDAPDASDLIDGGLLAIHRMRVTNLEFHLAPIDKVRYVELTGERPANDGFFGPPVFDSEFGPTRQYYFDHAVATAAARSITRLESAPGVEPGRVDAAVRSMGDFGMLIYAGPLVVNPDIRFEPNVVRPAVAAATGVDHDLFAERLVAGAVDPSSNVSGLWTAIGTARFIEDYLDPSAANSDAWARATDSGLIQLMEIGAIGVRISPDLFTPKQRERLAALRS